MKYTVLALLCVCISGCGVAEIRQGDLSDATIQEYTVYRASYRSFPTLMLTATNIYTHQYGGFDTNYRHMKSGFSSFDADKVDRLISAGLAPTWREEPTFVVVTNASVTQEAFEQIFSNPYRRTAPDWWPTNYSRFGRAAYCAMYTTNNYGYGRMYLVDDSASELLYFSWSQQWCKAERVRRAFPERSPTPNSSVRGIPRR